MIDFSIVVCCYNCSNRIHSVIDHFLRLHLNGFSIEIIFVDNNCTDNTVEVINKLMIGKGLYFRIVTELKQGQTYARLKGVHSSRGNYILFCDDDNWLDEDYLVKCFEILSVKKNVVIIGGVNRPVFEKRPGRWIQDFFPAMAIGSLASNSTYVNWVYGAGMVVRREFYQYIFDNNIEFFLGGRSKSKQSSGDDSELCFYARLGGGDIWFERGMKLRHFMPAKRTRRMFFLKGNTLNNLDAITYLAICDLFLNSYQGRNSIGPFNYWFRLEYTNLKRMIYSLPRIFFGRHQFYNFLGFYQSLQLLIFLVFNPYFIIRATKFVKINSDRMNGTRLQ